MMKITRSHINFYDRMKLQKVIDAHLATSNRQALAGKYEADLPRHLKAHIKSVNDSPLQAASVHLLIPRDPRHKEGKLTKLAGNLSRFIAGGVRRREGTFDEMLAHYAEAKGRAGQRDYASLAKRWQKARRKASRNRAGCR